jgi:uncharacterized protein (DUF58 family)
MERWLSKPRVLAALCAVLLLAALNRQDPMAYGMFLVLCAVAGLGYAWPWLSLRSLRWERRPGAALHESGTELVEGQLLDLGWQLRQQGWWPAWVVAVEAEWEWAGQRFASQGAATLLSRGAVAPVLDAVQFPCRGRYRLRSLRLRSGFPLGLVQAERELPVGLLEVVVHPRPWPVHLPTSWTDADDPLGDSARGERGDSLELSGLRPHETGQSLRHVDWRASARLGELVVRQFRHPASPMVRVTVPAPPPDSFGQPDSPAEQAVRIAAGICQGLQASHLRFALHLEDEALTAPDAWQSGAALAGLRPATGSAADMLVRVAAGLRPGEQLLAVIPPAWPVNRLLPAASEARQRGAALQVAIGLWPGAGLREQHLAEQLRTTLDAEGVRAWSACT